MMGLGRSMMGIVQVRTDAHSVYISGIQTPLLFKDMDNEWRTSKVAAHMFRKASRNTLVFDHFFLLDFIYVVNKLIASKTSRSSKRHLIKIRNALMDTPWIKNTLEKKTSITDVSLTKNMFPFELDDKQLGYVTHYGHMVPAYKLRGYLLDAGAGSGKTASNLALGRALKAKKTIALVLNNSVDNVWRHTIEDLMSPPGKAWLSTDRKPLDLSCDHFVVHYEYLGHFMRELEQHKAHFENTFLIVDESHNFNRPEAQRTELLVELCRKPFITGISFSSGTAIGAMGSETIPMMRCLDPYFTPQVEVRFKKIFGMSTGRANDILRNRLGHMKFHVPKTDVVKVVEHYISETVVIPNPERFTLPVVADKVKTYYNERKDHYVKNQPTYTKIYQDILSKHYSKLRTPVEIKAYDDYVRVAKTIHSGYDPMTMAALTKPVNDYENKVIIPGLSPSDKVDFRNAKSVYKYPALKALGEALGNMLGRLRTECFSEIAKHADLTRIINQAEKKTLLFTSYVNVIEQVGERLREDGFDPILVYGKTSKDLPMLVKEFYKNESKNPLVATLQTLSTAVPITCANRVVFLNVPFRDWVRIQAISRVSRRGQDAEVTIVDLLLDTGGVPNLSTRNFDIMEWSKEMSSSILGSDNIDLDTLSLEVAEFENRPDMQDVLTAAYLPDFLYCGADGIYTDNKVYAMYLNLKETYPDVKYDVTENRLSGAPDALPSLTVVQPKEEDNWYFVDSGQQGILCYKR